jgi:hypothetical protein
MIKNLYIISLDFNEENPLEIYEIVKIRKIKKMNFLDFLE